MQEQVALNPVGESRDKRDQTLKPKSKEKKKATVTAEEVTDPKQSDVDQADRAGSAGTKSGHSRKRITRDTSPSSI